MPGNDKWLDAYKDPVASLYTLTQCICLSDVQADGDWKLIIADLGTGGFNMKLKVYKGKLIMADLGTGGFNMMLKVYKGKLIMADLGTGGFNMKLKVYKGELIIADYVNKIM